MADTPTIGADNGNAPVPQDTVFAYNGVTFGPYVKTKVRETPIMSGDGRMVKMSEITIEASGWITLNDATGMADRFQASHASMTNSGSGYTVGDVLTVVGGTFTTQTQIEVLTVSGGGGSITSYELFDNGSYSVLPANPVSVIGGTGTGAEFEMSWTQSVHYTLDALMLSIRRQLQVNGQHLQYEKMGYGIDLDINDPDGVGIRDVAFGPRPGTFSWRSLGAAPDGCHGAAFEWSVTTWIAECNAFQISSGVFLEVSFTVTYDVDEAGIVTITYAGRAQIPLSLRADNTLDRNIDSEIGRLIARVPSGFIRRPSHQLSQDRASCTFNIVDRQVEVPPPKDVVKIDMKHKIKQNRGNWACPTWDCTIYATIRMAPTANKFLAYRRFFNIAAQRMFFTAAHAPVSSSQDNRPWKPGVFIMGTEMEEDLFHNESRFTINYRITAAPLDIIVRVSGLWQPVVDNNTSYPAFQFTADPWNASDWTNSLIADRAQIFRGYAGAQFPNDPSAEIIIDVCNGPVGGTT